MYIARPNVYVKVKISYILLPLYYHFYSQIIDRILLFNDQIKQIRATLLLFVVAESRQNMKQYSFVLTLFILSDNKLLNANICVRQDVSINFHP